MSDLVILGAGGASREIMDIVAALNAACADRDRINVVGVFDDDASRHGGTLHGVPVRGAIAGAADVVGAVLIIGIASSRNRAIRRAVAERLGLPPSRWATLVHPAASIAPGATMQHGCVVSPHAAIGPQASVGAHVFVAPGVTIEAEADIGDGAVLSPLARIGLRARVGVSAYIGAGAAVRPGVTIGEGALVGMGAVVTADVPPGAVVVGDPARPL